MSPNGPGRSLRRRFCLGSGPLKRASDRVEFVSRLLVVLALLSAVPVGLAVGSASWTAVRATADAQAASRSLVTATLLFDAPEPEPGSDSAATTAVWTAPGGEARSARIDAPAGARAGEAVDIWVDRSGDVTQAPLDEGQVTGQAVVIGALAGLGLLLASLTGHLLVTWVLDRRGPGSGRRGGWRSSRCGPAGSADRAPVGDFRDRAAVDAWAAEMAAAVRAGMPAARGRRVSSPVRPARAARIRGAPRSPGTGRGARPGR